MSSPRSMPSVPDDEMIDPVHLLGVGILASRVKDAPTNVAVLTLGASRDGAARRTHTVSLVIPAISGFEIETQMTICAVRVGLRMAEVPGLEMPRRHGRPNLRAIRDGTRVLRTMPREHRNGISGQAVQGLRRLMHGPLGVVSAQAPHKVKP